MNKSKKVSAGLSIDPELRDAADEQARREDLSRSQLIVKAIKKYLKEQDEPVEERSKGQ